MRDIDTMLTAIRDDPGDPRLATMDARVMSALSALADQRAARRNLVLTGVAALGIGIFASATMSPQAKAGPLLSLADIPENAPSRLLMDAR